MEASAPPRPRAALRSPDRLRTCGDAELVRLVRLGDEAAFAEVYERHHRGILSFCRHMLGSRDEGEDAVQQAFISAYRDLRASDKPIHLKAWLYTIARNRCLSMLRARREQVSIEDVEPSTDGLAAEVQNRQDLRDMLRDLQRLPHDQREALVLSELGALSHEEIAMTLGVRKDKVKALVFQARESLTSSRKARETDCREIQQQLAILRGGSLRRTTLRRHLDVCLSCQAYRVEVQRQRAAIAAILPVVPTAGLKASVVAGAMGAGAAGAGGAASGGLLLGGNALAAKVFVGVALVGGGAAGGLVAVEELRDPAASKAGEPQMRMGAGGASGSTDAQRVVAGLRQRARTVGAQRDADQRIRAGRPVWGKAIAGSRTGPDPALVLIVAKAVPGAGGRGEARGRPPWAGGPKQPKDHQGLGAQGKGHAYGRGRPGTRSGSSPNASGTRGTPGRSAKPAPPARPARPAKPARPANPPGHDGRSRGRTRAKVPALRGPDRSRALDGPLGALPKGKVEAPTLPPTVSRDGSALGTDRALEGGATGALGAG